MYADPEAECQVGGNEDDDLDEDDHEDGGDNDAFDGNDHWLLSKSFQAIFIRSTYYVPS